MMRGAILAGMIMVRFSRSTTRADFGSSLTVAQTHSEVMRIVMQLFFGDMVNSCYLFLAHANHDRRLASEWTFQVTGGDIQPTALKYGATIDHARSLDWIGRQIEFPFQTTIRQVNGVNPATKISGVGDTGRQRHR